jgi:hypothetical protein
MGSCAEDRALGVTWVRHGKPKELSYSLPGSWCNTIDTVTEKVDVNKYMKMFEMRLSIQRGCSPAGNLCSSRLSEASF